MTDFVDNRKHESFQLKRAVESSFLDANSLNIELIVR